LRERKDQDRFPIEVGINTGEGKASARGRGKIPGSPECFDAAWNMKGTTGGSFLDLTTLWWSQEKPSIQRGAMKKTQLHKEKKGEFREQRYNKLL